jgi:hypothetical protein
MKNINEWFEELKESYGSECVWNDGWYNFSLADSVMDDVDEYFDIEKKYENDVDFHCAMGDDVAHCISVSDLSIIEKNEDLKDYIENHVGRSCYS